MVTNVYYLVTSCMHATCNCSIWLFYTSGPWECTVLTTPGVLQIEKEEQAAAEKAVGKEEFQAEWTAPAAEFAQTEVADWSEGVPVPSVPIQQFPPGKTTL